MQLYTGVRNVNYITKDVKNEHEKPAHLPINSMERSVLIGRDLHAIGQLSLERLAAHAFYLMEKHGSWRAAVRHYRIITELDKF